MIDMLAFAGIASGSIVLLFLVIDRLTLRGRGPPFVQKVGHRVFGTRRRAIAAYEAMLLVILLFWILPVLWVETAHPEVVVVLVVLMFSFAPAMTYVGIGQRFNTTARKDVEPGEMLELTIEYNFRNGHLDGLLSTLLGNMRKLGPDDVVVREYMHAKQRLLSRDDEVGQAFRDALKRLGTDQEHME